MSGPVPSARRPLPLTARADLDARPASGADGESVVVKDPVALTYWRLTRQQWTVLTLLDGRRSLEQLRESYGERFPTERVELADLQRLVADLHEKGLLLSNRLGQAGPLLERAHEERRRTVWRAVRNPLYIRLPGCDPEAFLAAVYPAISWLFRPWAVWLGLAFVLSSWSLFVVHFEAFERDLPQLRTFFGWPGILWPWLLMGAAKVLHELGHGFACKHYGGECHEIGVAFLVFSPCLYCDVSDAWTRPARRERLAIGAAGMYVELVLSAVALFGWWFTHPGLLHHLCLSTFLVTTLTTILFNLNPLLRYDGYYLLSDLLEIPNLRARSDRAALNWISSCCLGIDPPPERGRPQRHRPWFVLYAIASAAYRWFIVVTIALLLHRMLKPYGLGTVGLAFGVALGAAMVVTSLVTLVRLASIPRREPVKAHRPLLALAVLALIGWGVVCVPVPRRLSVPVVAEPRGAQHVYARADGRVAAIHVSEGDRVRSGDPLLDLEHAQRQILVRELATAREVGRIELAAHRALGDAAGETVAAAAYQSLDERWRSYTDRMADLRIAAPCDGVVVAAPEVGERHADREDRRTLPRWSGSLLEDRNLGAAVASGTHVLSIAPGDEFQAVAMIGQAKRDEFAVGQHVDVKFEHLPHQSFPGRIADVSPREAREPANRAPRSPGDENPAPGGDGGRAVYRAVLVFDGGHELLRTGLHGEARITVSHRTLGQWLWRYACETLRFRM